MMTRQMRQLNFMWLETDTYAFIQLESAQPCLFVTFNLKCDSASQHVKYELVINTVNLELPVRTFEDGGSRSNF